MCGREIPLSESFVVARSYGYTRELRSGDPVCIECARANPWVLRLGDGSDPADYAHVCDHCGRAFWGGQHRRYCSAECGERERSRRRERSAVRIVGSRSCETCRKTFTPPRSDGRYCSSACRQKAYRTRKATA